MKLSKHPSLEVRELNVLALEYSDKHTCKNDSLKILHFVAEKLN